MMLRLVVFHGLIILWVSYFRVVPVSGAAFCNLWVAHRRLDERWTAV